MEADFSRFEKATVAFDFLKTNSTTHRNAFSAMAELVDNAYDASARNLSIDFVERDGLELFEILDDGEGMSHQEAVSVISFGHSKKKERGNQIGRYGNGLKSGGLHLGTELMLLTKRDGVLTALLISHRFHEDNQLTNAVFVPAPSFQLNMTPIYDTVEARERHHAEMDVIRRYAPLGNYLPDLFAKIRGPSGTLILISGLKRSVSGDFSFRKTGDDLILEESNVPKWQSSLRHYLSIIYLEPRMRIYLQGREVEPKKLTETWMEKRLTTFKGNQFKAVHNEKMREHNEHVKRLEEDHSIQETRVGELNSGMFSIAREDRLEQNKLRERLRISNEAVEKAKAERDKERRRTNNQTFYLQCGLNIVDRENYGISFYMNKRLIIANYTKNKFYKEPDNIGISMFVDLNYSVFLPTHDKQDFETKDFNLLVNKCNEALFKYAEYLHSVSIPEHLNKHWDMTMPANTLTAKLMAQFWTNLGYRQPFAAYCVQQPLNEKQKTVVKSECGEWVLCNNCRKWRHPMRTTMRKESNGSFKCATPCKDLADKDNFQVLPEGPVFPKKTVVVKRQPSISSDDCLIVEEPSSSTRKIQPRRSVREVKKEPTGAVSDETFRKVMVEVKREELWNSSTKSQFDVYAREMNASSVVENGQDEDEEDEDDVPTRSAPRVQAKKNATKRPLSNRRRAYFSESSDEEEHEVEMEKVPQKKSRRVVETAKPPEQQQQSNAYLTLCNDLLKAMGHPPVPTNGIVDIDAERVVRGFAKKQLLKVDIVERRAEKTNETTCKMLDSLEKHFGGSIPGMPKLQTTPNLLMGKMQEVIQFLDNRKIPK